MYFLNLILIYAPSPSFLPLPRPPLADHLKEAVFPFCPLLLSLFPCSRPALGEGSLFLQKAVCSGAGFHSHMPFLCLECFSRSSLLDAAFPTWKTQLISTPAKPSPFSFCFVTLFSLCN